MDTKQEQKNAKPSSLPPDLRVELRSYIKGLREGQPKGKLRLKLKNLPPELQARLRRHFGAPLPPPKQKVRAMVINPRDCDQCGRRFKPGRAWPDATECAECTEALDDES